MKEIFNRDALIAVGLMLAVALAFLGILHFTDTTEALATCQETRSIDICERSIQP